MHAVYYSGSMERKAKDAAQSSTFWKLRCEEEKKERMAAPIACPSPWKSHMTMTTQLPAIVSSAIKPTPLH